MIKRRIELLGKTGQSLVYNRIFRAVKRGEIIRKRECVTCGAKGRTEFHHPFGYDGENAFRVLELCKLCHEQQHHS